MEWPRDALTGRLVCLIDIEQIASRITCECNGQYPVDVQLMAPKLPPRILPDAVL